MTTGKDKPIRDGFGHDVTKDVGATVVMYGVAPYDYPGVPWDPYAPPLVPYPGSPPPTTTTTVILTPRPSGFTLTVTGPDGTVMTLALTAEEWAAVRAAVLGALK